MIAIQCILEEHKNEAAKQGSSCCGNEEFTEVNVRMMTDDEQFVEIGKAMTGIDRMSEEIDPSNICLFVSCASCSFLDFTTIQWLIW